MARGGYLVAAPPRWDSVAKMRGSVPNRIAAEPVRELVSRLEAHDILGECPSSPKRSSSPQKSP